MTCQVFRCSPKRASSAGPTVSAREVGGRLVDFLEVPCSISESLDDEDEDEDELSTSSLSADAWCLNAGPHQQIVEVAIWSEIERSPMKMMAAVFGIVPSQTGARSRAVDHPCPAVSLAAILAQHGKSRLFANGYCLRYHLWNINWTLI